MIEVNFWRRAAAVAAAGLTMLLGACNTPPAYSVTEQPYGRTGTVESIQTRTVQNVPNAVGAIGGALIGGGFVGYELASKDQTLVWDIGIRYDDGSYATVQQTAAPGLRIGDRVRVTGTGIELLRG
jgi:outer membrane lipoprotein SlyB